MSSLVGKRKKERPAEAALESHAFLLRGAYVKQVGAGIFSLFHPALRIAKKIERIIREEMDRVDGQEVMMPVVQPKELWEASGRYGTIGPEMVRFQDRSSHDMVLAMTHEEATLHLVRDEVNSYKQLPFMVYQLQTKFRDEPRSRGGLIRVREFTMTDGYSFHRTLEDLEGYYARCKRAYERLFARAGLTEVTSARSDSGMMGGKIAHEFMLLCEAGEDTLAWCEGCGYLANTDVARGQVTEFKETPKALEKVHTPGMKTIEDVAGFLGVEARQTAKVVLVESDAAGVPVMALVRGDLEVNEVKLAREIGRTVAPASEATFRALGVEPGYASPMSKERGKFRLVVDRSIAGSNNLVCGANEKDYHYRNFNLSRDVGEVETVDIATAREGDGCPECGGALIMKRGIEVGNIFQLGTKYTETMGMRYLDEDGKEQTPIMGCYGIGVGRLISAVMEVRHDKWGPVWPMSISPWQVQMNALNVDTLAVKEAAETLYEDLTRAGLEVLYDDRGERPGVQFAEADLLGIPFRLILSERNLAQGVVEWKRRDTGQTGTMKTDEVVEQVKGWVAQALQTIEQNAPEAM